MTEEELEALRRILDRVIDDINEPGRSAGMSTAAAIEQYVPRLFAEIDRLRQYSERTDHFVRRAEEAVEIKKQQISQLREIVRVVAEADNSDMSICYQLCNVRWYGGETDAETMEMRHDAPCVVEKARAWLDAHPEEVAR